MRRPSHQLLTFDFRTLLTRGRAGRTQRRQLWEVVKVVGSICMFFGGIASLLAYFTTDDDPFREERLAMGTMVQQYLGEETTDRNEASFREVYLGEYRTMRGTVQMAASLSGENKHRVVDFEVSAVIKGTVDETYAVEHKLRGYEQRVREVMNEVARKASEQDLIDPETRTIRAQICRKLNSLVGKKLFDGIVFSRFRVYEN